MNAKKYLKQQAEQDRKEILDSDDGEFLRALQQQVQPEPRSQKRVPLRVWLPSLASAVAAVVLITCIAVYYPFDTDQPVVPPPQKEYLDANLTTSDSTLEELNRDVKEFDLQIDSALYTYSVKKTSDSVSGDVLYYHTTIANPNTFIKMEIVTVCNPDYQYKNFTFGEETSETTLTAYTVTYSTSTNLDPEFELEFLNAKAQIQKGQEIVYVTDYSELLLSTEGTFLETLQSIVK